VRVSNVEAVHRRSLAVHKGNIMKKKGFKSIAKVVRLAYCTCGAAYPVKFVYAIGGEPRLYGSSEVACPVCRMHERIWRYVDIKGDRG
jgi:hypothetical protein